MPTALSHEAKQLIKEMRPQVVQFCHEYLLDYNGKQAAIRAGYSAKTAGAKGSMLLAQVNVQQLLAALAKPVAEEYQLTAERVMSEVALIAFADPAELYGEDGQMLPIKAMPPRARRAIKGYDHKRKKWDLWSKSEALSLAARITKLVETDVVPGVQNQFVVVCPADATPDQWKTMVAQYHAQLTAPTQPTVINPTASTNGHLNGNGASNNGHP